MEVINGNIIFWLICLGMLVGGLTKLFFFNKGRGILINVAGGAAGALITGIIGSLLNINGNIAFSVMGAVAFLFLLNIFSLADDKRPQDEPV